MLRVSHDLMQFIGMTLTKYSFGAVLEEFEIRDALSNLFIAKENMSVNQISMPQQMEQIEAY
jgi:hypothetical protein